MLSNIRTKKTFRDYPTLMARLHPTKNQGLMHYGKKIDVLDVGCGSRKMIWMICAFEGCGKDYYRMAQEIFRGYGCVHCRYARMSKTRIKNTKEEDSIAHRIPEIEK